MSDFKIGDKVYFIEPVDLHSYLNFYTVEKIGNYTFNMGFRIIYLNRPQEEGWCSARLALFTDKSKKEFKTRQRVMKWVQDHYALTHF